MLRVQAHPLVSLVMLHLLSYMSSKAASRRLMGDAGWCFFQLDCTPKIYPWSSMESCHQAVLRPLGACKQKAYWESLPAVHFSPYQHDMFMQHDTKLITNKDLTVNQTLSQTKLPKLALCLLLWQSCSNPSCYQLPLLHQARGQQDPQAKILRSLFV